MFGMAETSAEADGTIIADQTLHVIYVYRKLAEPVVKKGSVDVKYIDRATGQEIPGGELAAVVTDAEAGTSYNTAKRTLQGTPLPGWMKSPPLLVVRLKPTRLCMLSILMTSFLIPLWKRVRLT